MSDPKDDHLVSGLRSGDKAAFDALMRRHAATVYRYAWAIADSAEQVDDLVQDTFLVLWRRRARVTLVGDSLLPWLLTTCRFLAFNANRKRRRNRTVPLATVEHELAADGDPASDDDLRWVADEISRLSERDRLLLDACLVRGETYDDAARALGITAVTARKRMQRVRERLRAAQLKEES